MKFLNVYIIIGLLAMFFSCKTESNKKHEQKNSKQPIEKIKPIIVNNDSCEVILKMYQNHIVQYIKSEDLNDLKPIFKINNDKTYNDCLKDKNYKRQFDSLENLIK